MSARKYICKMIQLIRKLVSVLKPLNPYPLRLDEELMEQLKVMAEDRSRSVNKEIEYLVKMAVRKHFEKEDTEEKKTN